MEVLQNLDLRKLGLEDDEICVSKRRSRMIVREHVLRRIRQPCRQLLDWRDDTKLSGYGSGNIRRSGRISQECLHDRTSLHGVMPVAGRMSQELPRRCALHDRIFALLHERAFDFGGLGAFGLEKDSSVLHSISH